MTKDSVVSIMLTHPQIYESTILIDQKKESLRANIDVAVGEIIRSYPWDFAIDVTTETAVVGQSEYVLRGKNTDCNHVVKIKYGDGGLNDSTLEEKTIYDMWDDHVNRDFDIVKYWYKSGRDTAKMPKVVLVGTPTSGETITYIYYKKNIGIDQIPDDYINVVISGTLKNIFPGYLPLFRFDLERMIHNYELGGNEFFPIKLNPETKAGNTYRNGLGGW